MTPEERFNKIINHQESDRIPIDVGATTLTGMTANCHKNLKEFLGFTCPDESIDEWGFTGKLPVYIVGLQLIL